MEGDLMKIKLSKAYQNNVVFNNFEMEIFDHTINVILGPSGCGKTTLLHCISELCDFNGKIMKEAKNIGYVFQEDRLFPYLTVMKNLLIIDHDVSRVEKMLETFQVYDLKDQYPHALSGGEKQRISIIRAFLGSHDLILMDEPFKSLDYHLKMNLVKRIQHIQEETKVTMILVTHDLDIAMYLGKYIHVLSEKVTSIKETIENPYTNQGLNEKNILLHNRLKGLMI